MGFPASRPRRLRRTSSLRRMVRETSVAPGQLVLPLFVREGASEPRPISSMPGVVQHTRSSLLKAVTEAAELGLGGVMLFGIPEHKDAVGSGAVDPGGILNLAINDVVGEVGDALTVMSDLCLDEFTDHGHCGVLTADGRVDNDATLTVYAEMARAHAAAGVDMVGPSGMMDGQVAAIRTALDEDEHQDVSILAYSAKYASAFFGPFREAVASSLEGDRRTYQQDSANAVEGVREALLDVAEGADIVMVKPALAYLDVIRRVRDAVDVPVAAYNVSGEYAMVEAAAANGWIDREAAILETLTSIRRAGADVILTYWAADAARSACAVPEPRRESDRAVSGVRSVVRCTRSQSAASGATGVVAVSECTGRRPRASQVRTPTEPRDRQRTSAGCRFGVPSGRRLAVAAVGPGRGTPAVGSPSPPASSGSVGLRRGCSRARWSRPVVAGRLCGRRRSRRRR